MSCGIKFHVQKVQIFFYVCFFKLANTLFGLLLINSRYDSRLIIIDAANLRTICIGQILPSQYQSCCTYIGNISWLLYSICQNRDSKYSVECWKANSEVFTNLFSTFSKGSWNSQSGCGCSRQGMVILGKQDSRNAQDI